MAVSITDRDANYMKKMWGTNKLITDYESPKVLQEVMYDPTNKVKSEKQDLFEDYDENEFDYGVEPTYKLNKGQKLI